MKIQSFIITICLLMLLCVHNFHQERFQKEPFLLSFTISSFRHILAFFADIVMALFYMFFLPTLHFIHVSRSHQTYIHSLFLTIAKFNFLLLLSDF